MRPYKVQVFATPVGASHMNNSVQRFYTVLADNIGEARSVAIKVAYLDGDIEHVNPRTVTRVESRAIEPHDLELYTINTGQFYETHKRLARESAPVEAWRRHVAHTAVPLYGREIESAYALPETIGTVAANLKAYYERHIAEMGI